MKRRQTASQEAEGRVGRPLFNGPARGPRPLRLRHPLPKSPPDRRGFLAAGSPPSPPPRALTLRPAAPAESAVRRSPFWHRSFQVPGEKAEPGYNRLSGATEKTPGSSAAPALRRPRPPPAFRVLASRRAGRETCDSRAERRAQRRVAHAGPWAGQPRAQPEPSPEPAGPRTPGPWLPKDLARAPGCAAPCPGSGRRRFSCWVCRASPCGRMVSVREAAGPGVDLGVRAGRTKLAQAAPSDRPGKRPAREE